MTNQNNAAQAAEKAIRAAITLLDGDLDHENAETMRGLLSQVRAPVAGEALVWRVSWPGGRRPTDWRDFATNPPPSAEYLARAGYAIQVAYAAPLASAEPLVRYCPGCGSVGQVEGEYLDCCPDGGEARMIPAPLAEKCRDTFKIAVKALLADAAANEATLEQVQLGTDDGRKIRADAFIAGFICAGGDADEAKRQAPQFQTCVDAGRESQSQPDKAKLERLP